MEEKERQKLLTLKVRIARIKEQIELERELLDKRDKEVQSGVEGAPEDSP